MRRYNLAPLASSLFIQAAITIFFTLGPLAGTGTTGGWRATEVLLAGAAAAVGVFVRTGAPQSRPVVLGFEAIAVAVGAYGLMAEHVYLPGTIVGIGVLVRVASLPSRSPAPIMPAGPPTGFPQYGEPCAPDGSRFGIQQPYAQPQYGAPQPYAQPQYGAAQPYAQPAAPAPSPYESAAPTPPPPTERP